MIRVGVIPFLSDTQDQNNRDEGSEHAQAEFEIAHYQAPKRRHWDQSTAGVTERGKQLGVIQKEGEVFMRFKARVVKAAGPGEWMEEMLRDAARFGDEQYDALYGYFNDIPREKVAHAEAA